MDTYEGDDQDPVSLHKYLYANVNPTNEVDPSGNYGEEVAVDALIAVVLLTMATIYAASLIKAVPISTTTSPSSSSEDQSRGSMRVQLQAHRRGVQSDPTFGIPVAALDNKGVRVSQVSQVLYGLYVGAMGLDWFNSSTTIGGNSLDGWLLAGIAQLQAKLARVPPGGVKGLQRSFLQAVTPGRDRKGWQYRIDIDNLSGWNLRLME